jgi:hypothetical protein
MRFSYVGPWIGCRGLSTPDGRLSRIKFSTKPNTTIIRTGSLEDEIRKIHEQANILAERRVFLRRIPTSAPGQLASAPGRRVSASKGYCKRIDSQVLIDPISKGAPGGHTG